MPDPQGGGPLGLDGSTMLAVGGFVLGFALIVVFLSFATTFILAYICVPGGVVPGAMVFAWGLVVYRREQRLKEFATWITTYRRISMAELAAKLGTTGMKAERTLTQAIALGYVKGVVDRATDEFVLQDAERQQTFLEKCPHCGGVVNRWAFPEERFPCPYCNLAVELPAASG